MWLWYAYRIDGMSEHPEMALGCSADTPGNRRCQFDEFLRYIEDVKTVRGNPAPWTGSTQVGDVADPDVEGTAKELDEMGDGKDGREQDPAKRCVSKTTVRDTSRSIHNVDLWTYQQTLTVSYRYENNPDMEKLFPGWLAQNGGKKSFLGMHTKVMDVVQKVRREVCAE